MYSKIIVFSLLSLFINNSLFAFCGFYVAKADTKLFNKASKVVMVRDKNRTVMTMSNDYQGDLKQFAIVIPVPTVLKKEQIHISQQAIIDHLDAYTAPRLVEYFDSDPCLTRKYFSLEQAMPSEAESSGARNKSLGVTIEAKYTVGEYDILILSAKQSGGLETWLKENNYRIPAGASQVLGSYIKQDMKFFVAKVNLKKQSKLGFKFLRPIAIAYTSDKFMLPIRLGTLNANGPQELFVFALTRSGRVETTNYRTVKIPSNSEVPAFVKNDFSSFYRAMFSQQVKKENMKVVFLEYAWDMNWCDPCAADPLSNAELKELGVFWLPQNTSERNKRLSAAKNVFVTRLHLRYTAETFPDDLRFQITANRQNYQGRYIIRHAWKGSRSKCEAARTYYSQLNQRMEKRAGNLANLTGWDISDIRKKMTMPPAEEGKKSNENWWKNIWK